MKKLFLALVLVLAMAGVAFASPFLVSDPNPASDNVTNGVYVEMAANYTGTCPAADVLGKTRVSIPDVARAITFDVGQVGTGVSTGPHWWCVAQVNIFGESVFVPFSFNKSAPASPANTRLVP